MLQMSQDNPEAVMLASDEMVSTVDSAKTRRQGRGWQISLLGLILLVLGAGISLALLLKSKDVWGEHQVERSVVRAGVNRAPVIAVPVPIERTIGAVLEIVAVFLSLLLVRDLVALAGNRQRARAGEEPRHWPCIAWRVAALVLLAWFASLESSVLQATHMSPYENDARQLGWGPNRLMRERLYPICGVLMLLGLCLGMGGGAIVERRAGRSRRPWWLFTTCAVVVALLLAATPYLAGVPYLVLLALEAVLRASRPDMASKPAISARLINAGIEVAIALPLVLALALVVARDFERSRREEPWAMRPRGRLARLLLLVAVAAFGVRLAYVTLPRIHPWMAQGFGHVLEPSAVRVIGIGFALFAMGLAARSLDHRPTWERPRWVTELLVLGRYAVPILMLISALFCIPSASELEPYAHPVLTEVVGNAEQGIMWVCERIPLNLTIAVKACLDPANLVWAIVSAAVVFLVAELAVRPPSARTAPFDRALATGDGLLRFLWLGGALLSLCIVALPVLLIAGQVIYHLKLNATDMAQQLWPR
jgi:hypothetical protein